MPSGSPPARGRRGYWDVLYLVSWTLPLTMTTPSDSTVFELEAHDLASRGVWTDAFMTRRDPARQAAFMPGSPALSRVAAGQRGKKKSL